MLHLPSFATSSSMVLNIFSKIRPAAALDSEYRITGGSWTSSRVSGNTLIRTARFTGTSNVCDYTATYVDGSDADGYTANAVYLSPYKVKAIATYEQAGLTTMQKVLIGAGILILAIVIALILYFLKRKKREDEEGA